MEHSIRKAFLASQNPYRRLDTLWRNRVRATAGGLEHRPLSANPKIFLHLIPVSDAPFSFDRHDPQIVEALRNVPVLFSDYAHYHRINVDGSLGYMASDQGHSDIESYVQVFWDGSVECCDASLLSPHSLDKDRGVLLSLPYLEVRLVAGLQKTLLVLKPFAIPLPLRLYLALVGARECGVISGREYFPENRMIDRNEIFFEPVMLEDWEANLGQQLRPLFDQLWNTGNFIRSFSYDKNGDWKPKIN